MTGDHDERLIEAFQSGDEEAFDRLVRRHQDVIYRLALRHLGQEDLAIEATQEVFIRAWHRLPRWEPGQGKLFTWLYRTTSLVCREFTRKKPRLRVALPLDEIVDAHPAEDSEDREHEMRLRQLKALVESLPPRQQDVIWLHAYENLPLREVATALGIPLGTVKSNYHKALCSLRERWEISIGGDEPNTARGDPS